MLRFDDRVVLVTGAGRGIGRAYALLFAERGAAVVVNDFGAQLDGTGSAQQPADSVVAEIREAGGSAIANYASVCGDGGATEMVEAAVAEYGRLDVVVNNAGFDTRMKFPDITLSHLRELLETNFIGTFAVTQAAWPSLIASGTGRIVNTTSTAAMGVPNRTSYGAAKGAVISFTRNLALEAEPHKICVNAVAPAAYTRMSEDSDMPSSMKAAFRRNFSPTYVASVVAMLAHESCEISGEVFTVGGGGVHLLGLSENRGYVQQDLTPEEVRNNLQTILDQGTAAIFSRYEFERSLGLSR